MWLVLWAWPFHGPGPLLWLGHQGTVHDWPSAATWCPASATHLLFTLVLRVRACSWSAGCATGVPGVTKQVCVEEDAGCPEVLLVQGLTSIHRQCHIMSSIYYTGGNGAAPAEPDPLITMGETESPSLLCLRPWPWMYLCQRSSGSPRSASVPLRGLRRIKVCLWVELHSPGEEADADKCAVMNALTSYDLRPQCFLTGKYSSKEMTGCGELGCPSVILRDRRMGSFKPAWAT